MFARMLQAAAEARGLGPGGPLTIESAFALVRDLPYRRPSARTAEAVVADWCGTCSGKHLLLHRVLGELGLASRLMLAEYWVSPESLGELGLVVPSGHPLADLLAQGPVADVHTFLEADSPDGPYAIDATIPLAAGRLGLPVNAMLRPGVPMHLAMAGRAAWTAAVPAMDLYREKDRRVEALGERERDRREVFIAALGGWLRTVAP